MLVTRIAFDSLGHYEARSCCVKEYFAGMENFRFAEGSRSIFEQGRSLFEEVLFVVQNAVLTGGFNDCYHFRSLARRRASRSIS